MKLTTTNADWLRYSLVFVWLATASASLWERNGQSAALLQHAGMQDARVIQWAIGGGAAVDAALGIAMWRWPSRSIYLAALAMMIVMTLIATVLEPSLWLHPLGPLTKNAPIAVALWVLANNAE